MHIRTVIAIVIFVALVGLVMTTVFKPQERNLSRLSIPTVVPDTVEKIVLDGDETFELLKEGRYEEAAAAFKQFMAVYPDSEWNGNAQYWLAETYYVTQDFVTALPAFKKVIADYPASRKVPDALLKIGFSNHALSNWADARKALTEVATRYPETTAARLARQRLDQMQSEGN